MTHPEIDRSRSSTHQHELITLAIVWQHRWQVMLPCFICLGLGIAYLAIAEPIYESEARVLVEQKGLSFDREDESRRDKQFLATQAEVIKSPFIVERALKSVPVTVPAHVELDPVSYVLKSLEIALVPDADVLKLSYRSPASKQPSALIEAIVESYKTSLSETERVTYSDTLGVLTQNEKELRLELDELQNRYERLRRDSPLVGQGKDTLSVKLEFIRRLTQQLMEVKARRIGFQQTLTALAGDPQAEFPSADLTEQVLHRVNTTSTLSQAADLPARADQTTAQMLRETETAVSEDLTEIQRNLWEAENRAQQLAGTLGPRHADYLAAKEQVVRWREIFEERTAASSTVLTHEVAALDAAESNLTAMYDEKHRELKALDDYLLKEELLLGNIERLETVHATFLTRLSDFHLADQAVEGGASSVIVRMLDAPLTLEKIAWPLPSIVVVLSGALGIAVGLFFVQITLLADGKEQRTAEAAFTRSNGAREHAAGPITN